jgi:hypothetical protein
VLSHKPIAISTGTTEVFRGKPFFGSLLAEGKLNNHKKITYPSRLVFMFS